MKIRALYKNLNTGFVNLSALLRYLRQRAFVGVVRIEIEIESYRAEIIFDESRRVVVREFGREQNQASGNPGTLKRLLERAQAPGGIIHVHEAVLPVEENETEDILELGPGAAAQTEPVTESALAKIPKPAEKIFAAVHANGNGKPVNGFKHELQPGTHPDESGDPLDILPLYDHGIEIIEEQPAAKKKVSYLSANEWEELTAVTAELLSTIDNILKTANLGFIEAFNKARLEISPECPFLHPERGVFHYAEGRVGLYEEVPPNLLVSGITQCLRRILNKLVSNPKFFALYKRITQQISILVRQRRLQFDKFGYTRQLEKIIKF